MEKERHLIALDLDGTLLTDAKKIGKRTEQAVARAVDAGHIVVIATGRPHQASIQYYKQLGLDTPMVNFNGALIHHPIDKKWKALHNPMPARTALGIIDICYQLKAHNIIAEIQDHIYLDQYDQNIIDIFHKTRKDTPFTVGSLKNELKKDPTSMLIHPKTEQIDILRSNLDDYHAEIIEHRQWGPPWNVIEIIKKGMNKAVGLKKIAYYYNIPEERIIAFGDEDNDMEMIDYAGVGVAMGNAIDGLKSIAKHVTETNEQDGVGAFLEEYLKLQARVV